MINQTSELSVRKQVELLNIHRSNLYYHATARPDESATTCAVLDRLVPLYAGKKIAIVWDNASWHRSADVRTWLSDTKYDVKLMAFPTYAPELNPQEHVWRAGRSSITHNKFIENIDTATDAFVDHLNNTTYRYDFLGLVHA